MIDQASIVVLIPHFNNPSGLLIAIKSIKETIPIDVLVVDDGSKKTPLDESYITQNINKNITVNFLYLDKNQGIEHALNKGLEHLKNSTYKYIARLDCDDICTEGRFIEQQRFLDKNKEVVIVGSFIDFYDTDGNFLFNLKLPTRDPEIKKKMYLNAMLIHPSIFFRKELLEKVPKYPTKYKSAEDYAFYFEIMKEHKFANINKVLVKCEINNKGISLVKRNEQVKNRLKIILDNFNYSPHAFYGLFRNSIIYIIPPSFLLALKKKFK